METFLKVYRDLNRDNVERITGIYTDDVRFVDPAHEIQGLDALLVYFRRLYENVSDVRFEFNHPLKDGSSGYVQWRMRYRHPRLKRGSEILVPGASFLKFTDDGKVWHHRDYFDMGSLLYEHLPIMGSAVGAIKRRFGA